jgi:hypothetical protein
MKTQEKIEEMVDGYEVNKTLLRLDLEVLVCIAQKEQLQEDYEDFMKRLKE